MDANELAIRKKLKDDFLHYASKCLKIRTKSGSVEPFVLNKAQRYVHERIEEQKRLTGKVRALILKGRQQGCCFSEHMKVLLSNMTWVCIKDIKIGDEVVACDEELGSDVSRVKKASRKFRTAIVEFTQSYEKETLEILFDNGARLEVTQDHRMLCKKRGGCEPQWRHVIDFKLGDEVRVATRPPNYETMTHEDGWFSGIIDGEGSHRGSKGSKRLSVHQTEGAILQRMKKYFNDIDMPYKEVIDYRTKCGQRNKLGDKPVHRLDIHRLPYLIELLARCRPTRFTHDKWYEGHELPGKAAQSGIRPWTKVIGIKSLGIKRVVDLQTSTKTFICEGLVSHNSTYVGGRFYHQVTHRFGCQAFILTHALDATQNLYKMAKRYYEHTPAPVKPQVSTSNTKELVFGVLDSGYKLGTAENKSVGRSATIQLLHGSEIAFWNNAAEHAKGIMQAVPNENNTEIILESTANGIGNFFHQQWQAAEAGISDFIAIFVPWFWQDEYSRETDESFSLTTEEEELKQIYNLTNQQLNWRRYKIAELSVNGIDGSKAFKQEYPCIVGNQRVGTDFGIIPIKDVLQHFKTNTGTVKKAWMSGYKETLEIKTYLGYTLECTLDHRIAIKDGFIEASKSLNELILLSVPKLATEYYHASWNPLPCIKSNVIIDEDFGLFLGFFMGDGSYSNHTLSFVFTASDTDSITLVESLILKLFNLVTYKRQVSNNGIEIRVSSQSLKPLFQALGLLQDNEERTKRKVCVPECIWRSPESVVKQFLKGLFDADGFAAIYAAGVRFFSKNEQFAKDVQLLLLAFGITCRRIKVEKKSGFGHIYYGNEIALRGNEARLYRDKIGFISKRKNGRMMQWNVRKNTGVNAIPLLYQDKVIEINALGIQPVYDLEIELGNHIFDAQGILVHNCCAQEAFQTTGEDTYIAPDVVMRARKSACEGIGKLIVGVDPARFGDDRTCIIRRRGRKAYNLQTYIKKDTMEVTGLVRQLIIDENPDYVIIDIGGLGAGIYDRLCELGFKSKLIASNAGSSALNSSRFINKRSEMWATLLDWLKDEPCQIPDDDTLHADLCSIRYKIDSNSRLQMEAKADMKKRGIRSPDGADALCLTFDARCQAQNNASDFDKLAATILSNQKQYFNDERDLYG